MFNVIAVNEPLK